MTLVIQALFTLPTATAAERNRTLTGLTVTIVTTPIRHTAFTDGRHVGPSGTMAE